MFVYELPGYLLDSREKSGTRSSFTHELTGYSISLLSLSLFFTLSLVEFHFYDKFVGRVLERIAELAKKNKNHIAVGRWKQEFIKPFEIVIHKTKNCLNYLPVLRVSSDPSGLYEHSDS